MERVGGRQEKMEGHCLTGQSPQWAVGSMEKEEVEEEEEEKKKRKKKKKERSGIEVRGNHTNDSLLYMLHMYVCYIIIASLKLIQK